MKSLHKLYGEKPISYYQIEYNVDKLFGEKDNACFCKEFIKEHYMRGKKKGLFSFDFYGEYSRQGKHVHTVSLYLLGKALHELFENDIKEQLSTFLPEMKEWYYMGGDFLYTWYLTALFHDVASSIEAKQISEFVTEGEKRLETYLNNFNIKYIPYKRIERENEVYTIPARFSENLIKNYFFYRADHKLCEHGILAGYLMLDRFTKEFRQNSYEGKRKFGKLKWHNEHLPHAAYIADAIICHNIWMCSAGNEEEYQRYGLSQLIVEKHPEEKLSLKNFPLQFMLCLLDTIEPIKRFECENAKYILTHIYIEKCESGFVISWDKELEKCKGFETWRSNIKHLSDWMKIQCEDETDCAISLEFDVKNEPTQRDSMDDSKVVPNVPEAELLEIIKANN